MKRFALSASLLALAGCSSAPEPAKPAAPAAAATPAPPAAPAAPAAPAPPANTQAISRVVDLGSGLSMLMGQGGNIGLSVGRDGILMIDDQFGTNAQANLARIEELAKGAPKYLINTHWHGDHSGGNPVFAGAGATIFSSENARKRMTGEVQSVRNGQVQPTLARPGWPVVTFPAGIDLHLNGLTVRAIRAVRPAHTDGDVMVYFVEADVLHTGDVFVNGRYPLIDVGAGGSLDGFIAVQKQIIALVKPTTKIIPGHGELGNKADVEAELAMMQGASAAIQARIKAGDTLEKIIAAKPLAPWQPKFPEGAPADTFVTAVYGELTKK